MCAAHVYLIAITAEAMSGANAAGKRNMDLFGVALHRVHHRLGGGTVRDPAGQLPGRLDPAPRLIYLTIGAGLFTMLVARFMHHLRQLFLLLDAMGLIAFTVIGCDVALKCRLRPAGGGDGRVITGMFGGILRDIPATAARQVLRHELYASVSLLVALFCTTEPAPPRRRRGPQPARLFAAGLVPAPGGDPLALVAAGVLLRAGALERLISTSPPAPSSSANCSAGTGGLIR